MPRADRPTKQAVDTPDTTAYHPSMTNDQYRLRRLPDESGGTDSYWTCLQCGSLVGPMTTNRDLHSEWHAQLDARLHQ